MVSDEATLKNIVARLESKGFDEQGIMSIIMQTLSIGSMPALRLMEIVQHEVKLIEEQRAR